MKCLQQFNLCLLSNHLTGTMTKVGKIPDKLGSINQGILCRKYEVSLTSVEEKERVQNFLHLQEREKTQRAGLPKCKLLLVAPQNLIHLSLFVSFDSMLVVFRNTIPHLYHLPVPVHSEKSSLVQVASSWNTLFSTLI